MAQMSPFSTSEDDHNQTPSQSQQPNRRLNRAPNQSEEYDIPESYTNVNELSSISPIENLHERPSYQHESLEDAREEEREYQREVRAERRKRTEGQDGAKATEGKHLSKVSRRATQLYTISYLIFFSFFGTLARLGLQALTFYPGSPIVFGEIWANFGGCVFMGFLSEDRKLFRDEWGVPTYHQALEKAKEQSHDEENGSSHVDLGAAKRAHAATKKTIPLFIGLSTGLCGCFTSFSSFMRDVFLALSNTLPTPDQPNYNLSVARNGGHSFMALVAVIIATVAICMSGLFVGAHIAIATERFIPSVPYRFSRKWMDPITVFLSFGCWLGAVFLAIFPPDRYSAANEIWRGRAVFALVFAPLGCLGRFYISLLLNGKFLSFPLGTFTANISGTAILGMCWDLQHVPLGGVIGCQVLQGIEDGFCGCLTTVSTWVGELSTLRRRHAYRYGTLSIVVALAFLIIIMGSMKWTVGFSELLCTH